MKGLFPFIRQIFFGTKKPECPIGYCKNSPALFCYSGTCAYHCSFQCRCLDNQDRAIRAINKKENVQTVEQDFGAF